MGKTEYGRARYFNPKSMMDLIRKLYPICRSISGKGNLKTLNIIKTILPDLNIKKIETGKEIYDWKVPKEWNINDAYIIDPDGNKIVDFKKSNLYVMNGSWSVNKEVDLEELKLHIQTQEDRPDAIPYRTMYYDNDWGFCMEYNKFKKLKKGKYKVFIDSVKSDGHLYYGELLIKNNQTVKTENEIVISTYICHPSLANDNLSGIALTTYLAKHIQCFADKKYNFRFLFIPETIGSLVWLHENENILKNIKHGLIVTMVGSKYRLVYKKTRDGNKDVDLAAIKAMEEMGLNFEIDDFFPSGSDERQFCSPIFNLPFGSIRRFTKGYYPEYHTSDDNLEFINETKMKESFLAYIKTIEILNLNKKYIYQLKGEPFLMKYNILDAVGGKREQKEEREIIEWIISMSDGKHSILDIAIKINKDFIKVYEIANKLWINRILE